MMKLARIIKQKGNKVFNRIVRVDKQLINKTTDVIPLDYFVSPERVYLASADNFKGIEGLVELHRLHSCKHFYSVIGGMAGLNILCRLENVETITWFDINPYMIDICRLIIKLITTSTSRDDFISLIYCRPFSKNQFPQKYIERYYEQTVSDTLKNRLMNALTPDEWSTYSTFYAPYTFSQQQDFVLGPCLHCTALKVYHDLDVDGVMTFPFLSRTYIQKHQIKSVNSFFFGKGWLRNEKRFQCVKKHLTSVALTIENKSIFELEPPDEAGLYASNVLDGTESKFTSLMNKFEWTIFYSKRTDFLVAEYMHGDKQLISCERIFSCGENNPHKDCCLLLDDILNIQHRSFLEIIHPCGMEGMNSGFRSYFGQKKIHVRNYLADNIEDNESSIVILHMLMGNGCAFDTWRQTVKKAIDIGMIVCVFEHNPTAPEWPEMEVCHWNIPPIIAMERFLLEIANAWKKYATLSLKGQGIRNYCWIYGSK